MCFYEKFTAKHERIRFPNKFASAAVEGYSNKIT